jgi:hypothetical protein
MKYKNGDIYALKDYGKVYRGDDMSALNVIFRLGNFKSKILDPIGSNVIYGSSGNWGINENNWYSWQFIDLIDGKSIMSDRWRGGNSRLVKCLHQGGGTYNGKLNYSLFNQEFRKHIQKVTGFNE